MSFDNQPVLRSELVELRPLRIADYDQLFAVASDPRIWQQHPVRGCHEEEEFRSFFRESLASGGALIAIDRRTEDAIGSARFHGYDGQADEVEIGWIFLARSHWGGVYNREITRLMLEHAFQFVNRVVWLAAPQNVRSQRAAEKLGGVRAGSRPDGGGRDSYVYQFVKSELT